MDEQNTDTGQLSRRSAVKRIGAGAALIWVAPVVVSHAGAAWAGSPPEGGACTPGELVSYESNGWRYLQVAHGANPGFEAVGYNDSGWSTGQGGFASGGGCAIQSEAHTNWALDTDMLLRRTVSVPATASAVTVGIAIDNDVQVYWDGVLVGGGPHEGCATIDTFVIPVPTTAGSRVLAIRGVDRGVEGFLDARVFVECQA